MALNSTHPSYDSHIADWQLMRDAYAGERVVKSKGLTYLPATPGQIIDGMGASTQLGQQNYESYKLRAVFHDYVSEAVETYLGYLHMKPAVIELPAAMEGLLERATINGETIETLLRRINEQQLVTGRIGLLLDLPQTPDPANPLPYIATYNAEAIINWDDSDNHVDVNSLNLVVLDESGFERDSEFNWVERAKYRVLMLSDAQTQVAPGTVEGTGNNPDAAIEDSDPSTEVAPVGPAQYKQGLFYQRDGNMNPDLMISPVLRGQTLEKIPFVIVNSKDVVATPDDPPLLGLGQLSMTIYRAEADYRYQLFMQGQDTMVIIGGMIEPEGDGEATRVGAGSKLEVNLGGDAKYIGVSSTGLVEVRSALENDKQRAEVKAGSLSTKTTGQKESGDALSKRMVATTATLQQIALSGAAGLEKILRIAAEWMGQDPEKVVVTPNLEFGEKVLDTKPLVDMVTARTLGAPLSYESIHGVMSERGMTQMTYEDELAAIEEEDALAAKRNEALGLDPTGQVIPDPEPEDNNAPGGAGNNPASA